MTFRPYVRNEPTTSGAVGQYHTLQQCFERRSAVDSTGGVVAVTQLSDPRVMGHSKHSCVPIRIFLNGEGNHRAETGIWKSLEGLKTCVKCTKRLSLRCTSIHLPLIRTSLSQADYTTFYQVFISSLYVIYGV